MDKEQALLGAGCFWGVEEDFRTLPGIISTVVGYSGGTLANPTYEQVCSDLTGHAEVVHLTFDPQRISYEDLLSQFFLLHDPTQLNRQGPDIGHQYRSIIFWYTPEQERTAHNVLERERSSGRHTRPIVTVIEPAREFYPAEEYHQGYVAKRRAHQE